MHQQDVDEVREEGGWDKKAEPRETLRGCEPLMPDGLDYSNALIDSKLAFFFGNSYRSLVYADGGD